MSIYKDLYERLLAGNRVKLSGVTPATLKRSLHKAKAGMEAEAVEQGLQGFKLPAKHIATTQPDEAGNYYVWFEEPKATGFARKLTILGEDDGDN